MAVTVITGPPCSGKTTYVTTHAKRGDIIVDLDAIAHALTTADTPSHQYADHVRRLAIKARWSVLKDAAHLGVNRCNVWIIDGSPNADNMTIYRQCRARMVDLTASTVELLRRAEADQRPAHYRALILGWNESTQS
jgi:predicted kinase